MRRMHTLILVAAFICLFAEGFHCTSDTNALQFQDQLSWEVKEGVLTISGKGNMSDYEKADSTPWYPQREDFTRVVIGEGITSIGNYAFDGFRNISSVHIASSVKKIGKKSFGSCRALKSIVIPYGVIEIGERAFYYCNLSNLTIPDSVLTVRNSAFNSCGSLVNVTLSSNMTSIEDSAFNNCGSLTSINIPNSVISIGTNAFQSCNSLKSIIIPDSITRIEDGAFRFCTGLQSIAIPDNVKSIGECAFKYCSGLSSVVIPDGIEEIKACAFDYCNLTSIFYQGSRPFDSLAFAGYTPDIVCVPLSYPDQKFCSKTITPENSTCQEFQKMFNRCYKGTFIDGVVTALKRKNATEWERNRNECVEYQCDNETGSISWINCNSTQNTSRYCNDNGVCVENVTFTGKYVVIEFDDLKFSDVNETEIKSYISNAAGADEKDVSIMVEIDEDGYVVRIIVELPDVASVNNVESSIFLCTNDQSVSDSSDNVSIV